MKRSTKILITQANVSTVKTHLGRFLKQVRQGQEIIVLDRNHPVAKLVPFSGDEEKPGEIDATAAWSDVKKRLRENETKHKPTSLKHSSLSYLNQDRKDR